MQVSLDQALRGLTEFFEHEICEKASGVGKFTAYFVLPSVPATARSMFEAHHHNSLFSDLVDDDDHIELDIAARRARDAMKRCGSVEVAGFRLNDSDIDKLYDYIRRA